MKRELLIIAITLFMIVNTYYDGKYFAIMTTWKKYYYMIGYAFAGLSVYLYMKKNPLTGPMDRHNFFRHATELVRTIPMDGNSGDMITPMMDFANSAMGGGAPSVVGSLPPQQKRMLNSGGGGSKRSVGETKKKYVAAKQSWSCGVCEQQLSAWFEIDHRVSLEDGGNNEVDNLVALCRECHGRKTGMSRW